MKTQTLRRLLIALISLAVMFASLSQPKAAPARADLLDPSGQNPTAIPGYTQTYVDEFGGTALNTTDWSAYNNSDPSNPRGPKSAKLCVVDSGMLHLRVTKLNGVWTGSGLTSRKVNTTYGRAVVRARYDHGYGTKAVALMWPDAGWPPEIDFVEYSASDAAHSKLMLTNHYGSTAQNFMQHNFVAAVSGWHTYPLVGYDSAQWHTYDMTWTPTDITYRVDGTVVAVQSGHTPSQRMWLGLSNSLGRTASTKPNSTTPAVVDFDVDWVQYLTAS